MIDLLIGVDKFKLDLYLIPSICLDKFGSSASLKSIYFLKNNWDILINWNNEYLENIKSNFE